MAVVPEGGGSNDRSRQATASLFTGVYIFHTSIIQCYSLVAISNISPCADDCHPSQSRSDAPQQVNNTALGHNGRNVRWQLIATSLARQARLSCRNLAQKRGKYSPMVNTLSRGPSFSHIYCHTNRKPNTSQCHRVFTADNPAGC